MTNCSKDTARFQAFRSRKVEVNFSGGAITSDGGVFILRAIDKKIGLTKTAARALDLLRFKKNLKFLTL